MPEQQNWYCVRTVLRFRGSRMSTYEERLTLWAVPDFASAIEAAETEAGEYADAIPGCAFVGLSQAYHLSEGPGHGAEVFSLLRDSALPADAYLSTFFDTGAERQGNIFSGNAGVPLSNGGADG
jgi:hypothetical protein